MQNTFEQEFKARVDAIKARGKAVGLSLTEICKRGNIARATPDRWRNETPCTIQIVDRMDEVVTQVEQETKAK